MTQPSAQAHQKPFEPSQIAAALEHCSLLETKLKDSLKIYYTRLKEGDILGLALLEIKNLKNAAASAREVVSWLFSSNARLSTGTIHRRPRRPAVGAARSLQERLRRLGAHSRQEPVRPPHPRRLGGHPLRR